MSFELKKARQDLREAVEQINKAIGSAVDAACSAGVSERYISGALRNQMQHRAKPLPRKPEEWWQPARSKFSAYSFEERERLQQETYERLRQAERERIDERAEEARLSLEMINAGYKMLAVKHHPDKGGSRDIMARLNRGRERLKANV